ncbi:hypothetical protein F8160_10550 [Bacillus sp. CH126_4D]|uniref:hypothetical protein n=1 Tax=unclassified Bacillus (in: firmicutes) TaxID=185979 RepID=UPI00124F7727|nr:MULTISPECIES: hypothetical protein [unclassified Bacillus (in: firmicutes)]KAB2454435.1 hypothetical protein F8162_16955 [Bacillus sp. CH140a_4T]KAB2473801.1 hypothetical protein F8160_10550 [Bacillus sp. CH126_4D]
MNNQTLAILKTLSPGTNILFQLNSQAITEGIFLGFNRNTVQISFNGSVFFVLANKINAIAPIT